MRISMTGRYVLVTAGADGIGLAIATAMHAAGAHVHVCDINADALERVSRQLPGVATSLADVADETQVKEMFGVVKQRWGKLDALVNNAGISGPTASLATTSLADWQKTLDVNLTGAFLCAREAVPLLDAGGGGSIVNVSSVAGRLGFALRSPYSATKFGMVGLTQTWAMELGPQNIRVNTVLPGIVAGERVERIISARAVAAGVSQEVMSERMVSQVSLRKMVTAEDIASQILFLCSDSAASISGQSISVCGNVERLS